VPPLYARRFFFGFFFSSVAASFSSFPLAIESVFMGVLSRRVLGVSVSMLMARFLVLPWLSPMVSDELT
jgi:hypothetical protein